MKYFCYRNFHKDGVIWSGRNPDTDAWCFDDTEIFLKDVEFKVDLAGREKDLKSTKGIHAGAVGERILHGDLPVIPWIMAFYDYKKYPWFYCEDPDIPILSVKYCKLNSDGLWIPKEYSLCR